MAYCTVPDKIHTHPMEGHQKFLAVGGLRSQNFRSKVRSKTGISWGMGVQNKKPSVGEYGYFLELHILCTMFKVAITETK